MNYKKGFTLIELLAVIVVLAIIALIASPIVVRLIEDSKKSATERSADNYADGIKIAVANKKLNRDDIPKVPYKVMVDGNLCSGIVTGETCAGTILDIKMDGKKPTKGIVNLSSKGGVATATLCINDVKVIYSGGISEYKANSCTDMTYSENILNGTDPILGSNMIPVRISDNGTVVYADLKDGWYDYSNKEWANAVMLSSGTYNVGDTIPESAIRSYFVWIPRYKYKIFDEGNYTGVISSKPTESIAKKIEIVFENKNITASTGSTKDSWLTHPAFISFNTNGMWVGKFETGYLGATTLTQAQITSTDSSKIIVKPNVFSWRLNTLSNMFIAAYNYDRSNDSHMMKNTEWGAVAYLSHSKYGINKEININNNSAYKTGYSATDGTDQTIYPGTYGDDYTKTIGYAANGINLYETLDFRNGLSGWSFEGFTGTLEGNVLKVSSNSTGRFYPLIYQPLGNMLTFSFDVKSNIDAILNIGQGGGNGSLGSVTVNNRDWKNVVLTGPVINNYVLYSYSIPTLNATLYFSNFKLEKAESSVKRNREHPSTTGNITGIYDMSGGANEYMASHINGRLGASGFTTTTIENYNPKYFDVYSANSSETAYNYRILGDAIGEMGPFYNYEDNDETIRTHNNWYADESKFISSFSPWIQRGGMYGHGVLAGQFYFSSGTGSAFPLFGSRLVIIS